MLINSDQSDGAHSDVIRFLQLIYSTPITCTNSIGNQEYLVYCPFQYLFILQSQRLMSSGSTVYPQCHLVENKITFPVVFGK